MMEEPGNRYLEEQLQANLAAAVRVLSAAQRSLETHDAALANVVLGFEADARAGMRPVPAAVRADAVVEMVIELAMRVADLARVAWRIDRLPPNEQDVEHLVAQVIRVRELAPLAAAGDADDVTGLIRLIGRSDAHAATMLRTCEAGRFACLAS
jgi:hypothetical protein